MVHVGLHSVGTYHKKFGDQNKKKCFAECLRRTLGTDCLCRVLDIWHSAKTSKRFFAECRPADTRQRTLCRVPAIWHSAKNILIFLKNLCRVPAIWHSAKPLNNKPVVFLSSSLPHTLSVCFYRAPRRSRRAAPAAVPRAPPATPSSAAGHAIALAQPSSPLRPSPSSPRSGHLRQPPSLRLRYKINFYMKLLYDLENVIWNCYTIYEIVIWNC